LCGTIIPVLVIDDGIERTEGTKDLQGTNNGFGSDVITVILNHEDYYEI
jgi:hypothetical protein